MNKEIKITYAYNSFSICKRKTKLNGFILPSYGKHKFKSEAAL